MSAAAAPISHEVAAAVAEEMRLAHEKGGWVSCRALNARYGVPMRRLEAVAAGVGVRTEDAGARRSPKRAIVARGVFPNLRGRRQLPHPGA